MWELHYNEQSHLSPHLPCNRVWLYLKTVLPEGFRQKILNLFQSWLQTTATSVPKPWPSLLYFVLYKLFRHKNVSGQVCVCMCVHACVQVPKLSFLIMRTWVKSFENVVSDTGNNIMLIINPRIHNMGILYPAANVF